MPKRIDNNHLEIVEALREVGATVQSLASIGRGCPDLLVGYHNKTYLFEVKSGNNGLTSMEVKWIAGWEGRGVKIVRSAEQAIELITANG